MLPAEKSGMGKGVSLAKPKQKAEKFFLKIYELFIYGYMQSYY
jgi:hypothetical protein